MTDVIPDNETERLAAVRRYDILDTPPDGAFDRITALAARHFGVPVSIVSVVDHDRIWFKSHHGVDAEEIGRDPGLCASAILQDDTWVVEDAAVDPRTLANPLVAGEFGLRFYAGAPLQTHDGYNLGTLCIIDREPRALAPEEEETLADMAAIVMDELELRLAARSEVTREHDLREQAQRMARTLQASLLPPELPVVPGAGLAALYEPAQESEVGGDFYDAFARPNGGWALAIGDVSGKGAEAAAVTALARHTVRAAALDGDDPAAVLAAVNRAMFIGARDEAPSHFCTVCLLFAEPVDGGFSLVLAGAGHPPALIRRADGTIEGLGPTGPGTGIVTDAGFACERATLRSGDAVVLYTDGITEARAGGEDLIGEDGLAAVLREGGAESADGLVDRLRALLAAREVTVRDDAAALVLRAD